MTSNNITSFAMFIDTFVDNLTYVIVDSFQYKYTQGNNCDNRDTFASQ